MFIEKMAGTNIGEVFKSHTTTSTNLQKKKNRNFVLIYFGNKDGTISD